MPGQVDIALKSFTLSVTMAHALSFIWEKLSQGFPNFPSNAKVGPKSLNDQFPDD
jgi:hypothetical protein